LQSRYYNPQWGRFLNGDNYGGTIGVLLSHNIYAYCSNNPINASDPSGYMDVVAGAGPGGAILGYLFNMIGNAFKSAAKPANNLANSYDKAMTSLENRIKATVANAMINVGLGLLGMNNTSAATTATTKASTADKVTAVPKIQPRSPTQYWAATSNAVPTIPLTYSQAQFRVATGGDIMCVNQVAAYGIAKWYPNNILDGPHGDEGYYPHYHINADTHGAPHIWFYPD
jgi:uncharacterized protein YbjQ (UPF0145 family)